MNKILFSRKSVDKSRSRLTRSRKLCVEQLEARELMAVRVWDGNALSNNMSNAANWALNTAPKAGDDIVFPAGIFNDSKVVDNNFPSGISFNSIRFEGAGFTLKGNRISIGAGGISDISGGSSNIIQNDLSLGSTRTINVSEGANLFLQGSINSGAITKTGEGNLALEGNNSYGGLTTVNQGRIIARKETSLGTTAVGTVVNPKAALLFEARNAVLPLNFAEQVTVNAGGTGLTTFIVDGKVNVTAPIVFNGRVSQTTEATSTFVGTGDVTVTSTMSIVDYVHISGSNLKIAGNIVLATAVAVPTSSLLISGDCVVSGQISGVLGVEIKGTVTFEGSTPNTYQKSTFLPGGSNTLILNKSPGVNAIPHDLQIGRLGTVIFKSDNQIPVDASVTVLGTFDLNGRDQTLDTISLLPLVDGNVTTDGTLRKGILTIRDKIELIPDALGFVQSSGATISGKLNFNGKRIPVVVHDFANSFNDLVISAEITNGGLIKQGAGNLLLTGNNDYSQPTNVEQGLLRIHGSQPNSTVVVESGARLAGIGTVKNLQVKGGARLHPGGLSAPGKLTVKGDLTLDAGSILEVTLNNPIAGTGYDQIDVEGPGSSGPGSGLVSFHGAILEPTVGLGNAIGDTFRIIENDDIDIRSKDRFFFNNAPIEPNSAITSPTGDSFSVNYAGGLLNNDIVLTKVNAPALFPNRSLTPVITEGGEVVLRGTVSDPNINDKFILTVDWGDGSALETHTYGSRFQGKQIALKHRYRDDLPPRVVHDLYKVKLTWSDQLGAGSQAEFAITVKNKPPVVYDLKTAFVGDDRRLNLSGQIRDFGTADTHTMLVQWTAGGKFRSFNLPTGSRAFNVQHRYQYAGTHEITIILLDDDGGVTTRNISVFVV